VTLPVFPCDAWIHSPASLGELQMRTPPTPPSGSVLVFRVILAVWHVVTLHHYGVMKGRAAKHASA